MEKQEKLPILTIRAWPRAGDESYCFAPDSAYVQLCWLPVLGPIALCVYERLLARAISVSGTATVDLVELALSIGVDADVGPDGTLGCALEQLDRMGLIAPIEQLVYVRRVVPPLPWRDQYDLPPTVRALERLLRNRAPWPPD